MLTGKYNSLNRILDKVINKNRIFHDPLHLVAYGMDASFYRLIPQMVIKADNEDEVALILKECSGLNIPVTFRAAGTSLSGQAVTDSLLLIAGDSWKRYNIMEEGKKITLQPGITGGKANSVLSKFGRKIGPDPASINAAMIGGIAANNASGMCCGTAENSYKTVAGIRIILADGTLLDTEDHDSKESFSSTHSTLLSEISRLADSAKNNESLAERIRKKYKMKNTTGYSLNALVDFTDPFDIIAHLMIGSEGTLGFIASITYQTVVNQPFRASSLMIFPDIAAACIAVTILKAMPVAAVELIDRAGLRSVENGEGMPGYLRALHENASALLVETTALSSEDLAGNIERIKESLRGATTVTGIHFTDIPGEYEKLWKIRKGLFPSVGAMRRTGTTVIIEDVAFPVPALAEATLDLQQLLRECGYNEAVIFGHALEGNLHFVFNQDFGSPEEVDKYSKLMSGAADLVVHKYGGSLKAEHGTGRNMAPFVEMEWGYDAYMLMKAIKRIFDPLNILNPGVILNPDPEVHLRNLKPVPASNEITDKCTECGFCESSCVSAGLTLTPRQRIVVHREITSLRTQGYQPHIVASMEKSLRAESSRPYHKRAMRIADNMDTITALARTSLSTINFFHTLLGSGIMKRLTSGLRSLSGNRIPAWSRQMPSGAGKIRRNRVANAENLKVVYFPSCINRSMGVSPGHKNEKQLSETLVRLLQKGGYEIIYPGNLDNLCCGMSFSSKGYTKAGEKKSKQLEEALMDASQNGKYPVLCDMSPCLYTMKENIRDLKLYEPVEFISDHLVPLLKISPLDEAITVFPVCSMKKMGLEKKLTDLAALCAREVIVPETNCCGFAGDRGFTYPELNEHGLRDLRKQIPGYVKNGYSNSRTCEIGLSLHSGIDYKSIVYLVDKVTG